MIPFRLSTWLVAAMLALLGCDRAPELIAEPDSEVASIQAELKVRSKIDAKYMADGRIALLLQACQRGGYYDRDTGDTLAILLDKLQTGSTDSLHRAKEELGSMGEIAAAEVSRLMNASFNDPMGGVVLQNSIEVLGLMRTPGAHDPLMRSLNHPRDTVRGAALRALAAGAAQPRDFDRLLSHVEVEGKQLREQAIIALAVADRDRVVAMFLTWLEQSQNSDLWGFLIGQLFKVDPEPLREKALELYDKVGLNIGLPLAAIALDTGDPGPRAFLDKHLASTDVGQRFPSIDALIQSGRLDEVVSLAQTDPDARIRQYVLVAEAEAIGKSGNPGKETLDRFHAGLNDSHGDVRKVSLKFLLGWRDGQAQDRALSMIGGTRSELQEIVLVVGQALKEQPEFSARVMKKLLEIEADNQTRPLGKRLATLQAIGQVPLPEAASYLLELGDNASGQLQGLRAFRGLMVQASNTGIPGRQYLASKLSEETDPIKRLDMIWAISAQRDEFGVQFLVDFVQSDQEPFELLFASGRLAKSADLRIAAPLLKRVTLRIKHPEVRRALNCLLWRRY